MMCISKIVKKDGKYYSHNNTCEEKCEIFHYIMKKVIFAIFTMKHKINIIKSTVKSDVGYGTNKALDICEFCHDKKPSMN